MTDSFTQLQHLIKTRRSIRRYTTDEVDLALVLNLLETAMYAPSAHNRQPWRFAVVTRMADKIRLAKSMGNRLRADRTKDGDDPIDIEQDVTRSYSRLTGAPVLIVVCVSMADMDSYSDPIRQQNEWTMAVQSTAMAAQNFLLLAHAAELSACWLCAPLFVPDLVRETLDLAADWHPQGIITLGYAGQERTKTRQPVAMKVKVV
ncbi:nitroreductase family protein [Anaerolineales bacterium HSG6]|nr:nitroreductase family protein [Anaerolineales bacterium HSG6]MDM8532387.1 nitroreductase family protein [Anaerolineales bacterium HSG25]